MLPNLQNHTFCKNTWMNLAAMLSGVTGPTALIHLMGNLSQKYTLSNLRRATEGASSRSDLQNPYWAGTFIRKMSCSEAAILQNPKIWMYNLVFRQFSTVATNLGVWAVNVLGRTWWWTAHFNENCWPCAWEWMHRVELGHCITRLHLSHSNERSSVLCHTWGTRFLLQSMCARDFL